ncbi:hypothetical protein [Streptomyces lavenduligriseus]|uniref:Uncharacterized protein n=1 Tax=Streptomyces lavenduligriseus TaxID=67315 RepID=A0ABT0NKE2_9ACTN|nr:hypothetical protein [Streptomyces lavenduligriseus]MCL3991944.1 hypothetical protein [Streptomyces lavenduligriseus]
MALSAHDLSGRTAFVTGAGSGIGIGIGRTCAAPLAEAGARGPRSRRVRYFARPGA